MGVGRDILISKKLFLVTMRTMRKDSLSCIKARRSRQILKNGNHRRGNLAREKKKVKWFCLTKNVYIYTNRSTAAECSYFVIHKLSHCN